MAVRYKKILIISDDQKGARRTARILRQITGRSNPRMLARELALAELKKPFPILPYERFEDWARHDIKMLAFYVGAVIVGPIRTPGIDSFSVINRMREAFGKAKESPKLKRFPIFAMTDVPNFRDAVRFKVQMLTGNSVRIDADARVKEAKKVLKRVLWLPVEKPKHDTPRKRESTLPGKRVATPRISYPAKIA